MSNRSAQGMLKAGLVVFEAFEQVRELPAVAVVEQEPLDGTPAIHFGKHASIDPVKHPRHADEQGWLHLTCTDRQQVRHTRSSQLFKAFSTDPTSSICTGQLEQGWEGGGGHSWVTAEPYMADNGSIMKGTCTGRCRQGPRQALTTMGRCVGEAANASSSKLIEVGCTNSDGKTASVDRITVTPAKQQGK